MVECSNDLGADRIPSGPGRLLLYGAASPLGPGRATKALGWPHHVVDFATGARAVGVAQPCENLMISAHLSGKPTNRQGGRSQMTIAPVIGGIRTWTTSSVPLRRPLLYVGRLIQARSADDSVEPYSSFLGSLRFNVLVPFSATMTERLTESSKGEPPSPSVLSLA